MNNEIKTYKAMFDYELVKIDGIEYIECLDTGDKFFTFYDKQNRARFSTFSNSRVRGYVEAIEDYESAFYASWERDYRAHRTNERGAIIS